MFTLTMTRELKPESVVAAMRGITTCNVVMAIKEIRLIEECGLKEAKDAFDAIKLAVIEGLARYPSLYR